MCTAVSKVTAVILNWNGYKDTKACVESVLRCGYPKVAAIVVDNASIDGSGRRLAAEADGYQVLLHTKNDGFARGCNVGIREGLRDHECQYVLLINNDAELARGSLSCAVARAEASPRAGLVGGKILQNAVSRRIWSAGGNLDLVRGQAVNRGGGEADIGQFDSACRLSFVTCALALVRRDVFERVGLLPQEYFFGQEEWDFSLATARAGFELWYEPKFVCYHEGDGSHSNSDPKFIYNSYRNKLIFQQKYLHPLLWPLWLFAFDRIYARIYARAALRRLHVDRASADDLAYALRAAIRDHRREGIRQIEERDMLCFAEELAEVRRAIPAETPRSSPPVQR